jgi:hypothetical protein
MRGLGVIQVKLGLISEAKELNCRIPAEYHQVLDVFGEQIGDALPHHPSFTHPIELKDGTDPHWGPIYIVSTVDLTAIHEYLDKILRIRKSS